MVSRISDPTLSPLEAAELSNIQLPPLSKENEDSVEPLQNSQEIALLTQQPDALESKFIELIEMLDNETIEIIEQRCGCVESVEMLYQVRFNDITKSPLLIELINLLHFLMESNSIAYSAEMIAQYLRNAKENPRGAYQLFIDQQAQMLLELSQFVNEQTWSHLQDAISCTHEEQKEGVAARLNQYIPDESKRVFMRLILRKLWRLGYSLRNCHVPNQYEHFVGHPRSIEDFFTLASIASQDALHLLCLQESAMKLKTRWLRESIKVDLYSCYHLTRSLLLLKNRMWDLEDTSLYTPLVIYSAQLDVFELVATVNKIQKEADVMLLGNGSLSVSILHVPQKITQGAFKQFYRGIDAYSHTPIAALKIQRKCEIKPLTHTVAHLQQMHGPAQFDLLTEAEKQLFLYYKKVPHTLKPFSANENMITSELFCCDAFDFLDRYLSYKEQHAIEKIFSNIKKILFDLFATIESLHGMNIIHADVRVENILVKYNHHFTIYACSLTDFGFSGSEEKQSEFKQMRFTGDFQRTITPEYTISFPPELIQRSTSPVTASVDFFGFGVVIAEFLMEHVLRVVGNSPSPFPDLIRTIRNSILFMSIPPSFEHVPRLREESQELRSLLGEEYYTLFERLLGLASSLVKERPEERLTLEQIRQQLQQLS